MKVSDLSGERLDYWVAKARGYALEPYKDSYRVKDEQGEVIGFISPKYDTLLWHYSPSTDWGQGGPIIERENFTIWTRDDKKTWAVKCFPGIGTQWESKSLLKAAMRCFVASKFGEEVNE